MTHSDEVSDVRLAVFLKNALKPEEISGPDAGARVDELLGWFKRYFEGNANPKWLVSHAAELAYALSRRSVSNTAGGGPLVGDDINNLCICQNCQRPYVTDMLVPDDVWEAIKPEGSDIGAGLLCPTCIMDRASDRLGWSVGFVYPERHGAAITAGRAAGGGVKVKPLEWEDMGEYGWRAETIFGSYYLPLNGDCYNVLLSAASGDGLYQTCLAEGVGLEAARALCEADNAARVLSALEPIQAGGDEPVAWLLTRETEGMHEELVSLFAITDGDRSLGWTDIPLFTRPATPVSAEVTVTDEMVVAGKAWFDQNFNGCPDTETLVEGILTAALATLDRGRG